jgi:hypothetical protein
MSESGWQLGLGYLRVLLGWPPVALVISIVFFVRFHAPISGLIARFRGGNIFGQTIEIAPPSQMAEPEGAGANDLLTRAVKEAAGTKADGMEEVQPVKNLPSELANDPQAQAAIEWVKKNPEVTVVEYKRLVNQVAFERLYGMIYGTQISLLEFLAARPKEFTPLTQLSRFHLEYLSKLGATPYSREHYMDFLVAFSVIEQTETPQEKAYRITPHGIQFLAYIKAAYPLAWYQKYF